MSTLFFIAVGFLTSIVGDRLFLLQTDVVAETIDTIISRGEKYYEKRGDKENLLRAIEVLKEGKDSLKKESNAQSQDSSNNPRKEAKICSMLSKFYYKLAEVSYCVCYVQTVKSASWICKDPEETLSTKI